MKVRGDVINAAREMFRKRYRDIQGIGYDKSGSVCNGMMMCSDNSKWTYKMKDGTSGENFNIVKRTDKSSNSKYCGIYIHDFQEFFFSKFNTK